MVEGAREDLGRGISGRNDNRAERWKDCSDPAGLSIWPEHAIRSHNIMYRMDLVRAPERKSAVLISEMIARAPYTMRMKAEAARS